MKKTIITTILAGAMVLSLAACTGKNGTAGEGGITDGALQGVDSVQSVYGISAVTTAKLLEETKVAAQPLAAALAEGETGTDGGTTEGTTGGTEGVETPNLGNGDYQLPDSGSDAAQKAESEAETFNKYFTMLEGFMEKAATSTVVTENDSKDEALQGFAYKLIVKGKNEKDEENAHTMYYSETVVKDKEEKRDDDDDEVTTVSTYTLEGVLEVGKNDAGETVYYYMTGERIEKTEQEGNETETSESLTFYASATKGDRQNYVRVSHETENEQEGTENATETEYTYTVYQNGKSVEQTVVNFESENAEAEYELEYTVGGVKSSYEIEIKTLGTNTYIEVEYNIGGTLGRFVIVRDADGNYDYKFSKSTKDDRTFTK